jgi:hypothetical protein
MLIQFIIKKTSQIRRYYEVSYIIFVISTIGEIYRNYKLYQISRFGSK